MVKLVRSFVRVFFSILFLLLSNEVHSQITLSSGDILGLVGTSLTFEEDTTGSVIVDVGSPGANQTWDFRSVELQAEMINVEFLVPQGTPFAADFPQSNFVEKVTFPSSPGSEVYIYAEIMSSSYSELGDGIITPDTSFINFDVGGQLPLPVAFNNTWTETRIDTSPGFPASATISFDTSTNTVDAWGTVQLPAGAFDCLRVRFDQTEITQSINSGVVTSIDTTTCIEYVWVTQDHFLVAEASSQENDTDPNFTDASSFQRLASITTAVEELTENTEIPSNFELFQNYPNPFNPETEIHFQLQAASYVVVRIFNTLGQEIRTLTDKEYEAGFHRIRWDAKDNNGNLVSSGIYIYQLKAGAFSQIKKMSLIR